MLTGHTVTCSDSRTLNLYDNEAVNYYFSKNNFDIIINCAAYTKVDFAETEKNKAMQINANILSTISKQISKDSFFIHISNDYVFDGKKKSSYLETDFCNPINYYGLSKYHGEEIVKNEYSNSLIIRTAGLYSKQENNFVHSILKKIRNSEELNIINDQFTSTTNASDLADFIVDIIKGNKIYSIDNNNKIFHFVNDGELTWYDFALNISQMIDQDVIINKISYDEFKSEAIRPKFSILNNIKVKKYFKYDIEHYTDSLKKIIKTK